MIGACSSRSPRRCPPCSARQAPSCPRCSASVITSVSALYRTGGLGKQDWEACLGFPEPEASGLEFSENQFSVSVLRHKTFWVTVTLDQAVRIWRLSLQIFHHTISVLVYGIDSLFLRDCVKRFVQRNQGRSHSTRYSQIQHVIGRTA